MRRPRISALASRTIIPAYTIRGIGRVTCEIVIVKVLNDALTIVLGL